MVRHRAELGLPDASPEALAAVGRIAAQCLALTRSPTPGPVHLNARFRKPLAPVEVAAPEPWSAELSRLVTLGAAYLLHMDKEIGSIEVGKRADFAVLGADPLTVGAEHLKDVPVLGTVLGGQPVAF